MSILVLVRLFKGFSVNCPVQCYHGGHSSVFVYIILTEGLSEIYNDD